MDTGSPEFWRWVWLVAAAVLALGELAVAGSFFLAPFAIGATVAAILAFIGVGLTIEWIVFIGVSVGALLALRPIAHRMDREGPVLGIGSHRQVGQVARVLVAIDPSTDSGTVLLGAEKWRAESSDGRSIPVGASVAVIDVRGTRLLVRHDPTTPIDQLPTDTQEGRP